MGYAVWLGMASGLAWADTDEPCYGHSYDDRIQTEHFWIEWDPEMSDAQEAAAIARDELRASVVETV